MADPLKVTLSSSAYAQYVSHRMDSQSTLDGPKRDRKLTIDQYWARLKSHGFTPFRIREGYVILTGPDGQKVGITCPDNITQDQRTEELSDFLKTHMLN